MPALTVLEAEMREDLTDVSTYCAGGRNERYHLSCWRQRLKEISPMPALIVLVAEIKGNLTDASSYRAGGTILHTVAATRHCSSYLILASGKLRRYTIRFQMTRIWHLRYTVL
jgi:hypothetical protein